MGNSTMELPIYFENYVIFKALHRFKHHLVYLCIFRAFSQMKYIPFCWVKRYFLIELCTCRDFVIYHQKVQSFVTVFLVYC